MYFGGPAVAVLHYTMLYYTTLQASFQRYLFIFRSNPPLTLSLLQETRTALELQRKYIPDRPHDRLKLRRGEVAQANVLHSFMGSGWRFVCMIAGRDRGGGGLG